MMLIRYQPIIIAFITLIVVNAQIISKQHLINTGKSIFVALKPVDPRSLIQGDYMELAYQLNIIEPVKKQFKIYHVGSKSDDSASQKRVKANLDQNSVLISASFDNDDELESNQHWLRVKQEMYGDFYPVSNSYLFAEGLAYCYQNAKFAELRVNKEGKAVLYRLIDQHLLPLNCEAKEQRKNEQLPSIFS